MSNLLRTVVCYLVVQLLKPTQHVDFDLKTITLRRKKRETQLKRRIEYKTYCKYTVRVWRGDEVTHIFVCVGVLGLGLLWDRNLTVGAVVFTVVIGSTVVRHNQQLLDVSLETHRKQEFMKQL
jgi:hypothetical protein